MALEHFFAGPAKVQICVRKPGSATLLDSGAYSDVGYNREAIPFVLQPLFLDVPSDDWAGTDGAPADAQFMGAKAVFQLSLTKYDKLLCDRLLNGLMYGDTAISTGDDISVFGTFPPFGSFVRQGNYMFAMRLNSQLSGRSGEKMVTMTQCFVRGGGAVGQGTRYSAYDLQVEAWLDSPTQRQLLSCSYTA